MTINRKIAEFVGWYGTAAIVSAYALVSFDVISSDSFVFQLLNLTGAVGIIVISIVDRVKQTIVLNAFWALIAVIALARLTAN